MANAFTLEKSLQAYLEDGERLSYYHKTRWDDAHYVLCVGRSRVVYEPGEKLVTVWVGNAPSAYSYYFRNASTYNVLRHLILHYRNV